MRKAIQLVLLFGIVLYSNTPSNGSIISIHTSKIVPSGLEVKNKPGDSVKPKPDTKELTIPTSTSIRFIYEDLNGNYWIATEGQGVFKFDGEHFKQYTQKDGLNSNYVWTIQQDRTGNLWFGTSEGISFYNGMFFVDYTKNAHAGMKSCSASYIDKQGNIWFGTQAGVYKINSLKLQYIPLPRQNADQEKSAREYTVYSIYQDANDVFWFGTEFKGVCRYDGKNFSYIHEKGLDRGAVRSIMADKNGILWFGNNGSGLFRYDGKNLTNISLDNGVGNPKGEKACVYSPGTLARVWSITEDKLGKLWIATIDAGIWTYDGKQLKNYTKNDGLSSLGQQIIFKDKKNKLWFGSNDGSILEFKKNSFQRMFKAGGC